MPQVRLRRVYERATPEDGNRVLVDRLWPRGLSKAAAALDEWVKGVAPSDQLRRWFGHAPAKFEEFQGRYLGELTAPDRAPALAHLQGLARSGPLTLLTATRDPAHSHAAVLADVLKAGSLGVIPDQGGDPACWQKRVCPNCGALAESDPPTVCPECRAEIAG